MRASKILLAVIFAAILLPSGAFAHQYPAGFRGFADSASCAQCHRTIYDEWSASMHSRSSRSADPAHNAVFSGFSQAMAKMGKKAPYFCASCHSPASEAMAKTSSPMTGIPCTFCHGVEGLSEGKMFNTYKLATTITSSSAQQSHHRVSEWSFRSPYMMCLGCHGKMVNGKGTVICSADLEGYSDCVKCHMEEKTGPPAEGSLKNTHYSHLFPGGHDKEMLGKAITLTLGTEMGKLIVTVKNDTPHFFPSTNPMRAAYLKVDILDKDGKTLFESPAPAPGRKELFMRVFSADGRMGVPTWEATSALDSRIKDHEERALIYALPKGAAKAKATLYFRLFTTAAAAKFGIPAKSTEPVKVSEAEIEIK